MNTITRPVTRGRIQMRPLQCCQVGTTIGRCYKRLLPRINGGSGGGCPILVLGISEQLYERDSP